ncbi:hypothetical protein HPC49_49455 [Pyxidicoccus fallax]|uniref:Uncharacterized protein n=1 Tax=Pyxidicoccus fallax TaxID=394095 RepID=A0A848L6G8_9BACT|nr:hypothetical protein [Pyxidicoccus fallax]NMO14196.1 hypothetical protein [Pyxidicoccus fallax]NPC86203.1 hypothetical protein [Pyxidicoccus fallax]
MRLDELGREMTFEELAERYRGHDQWSWFLETRALVTAEVRPRLVEGSVITTENLETGDGPWALIIDGDLVTTGDIVFRTGDYATSALLVMGHLRARNLEYSGSARVVVDRDLTASGVIVGSWGVDGAVLGVSGTLTALAVLLDPHTPIWANAGGPRSVPEAYRTLIVGGRGWQEFTPDIDSDDLERHEQLFVPEVLERGILDRSKAMERAERGASPFLPEVEQALRAKKGLA